MATTVTFFPVGNGDMTLIRLNDADGTTILIDVNIRAAADDPDDPSCDAAGELRRLLKPDAHGRPYVDVFLLSHPDKDHCAGLSTHFHLNSLAVYDYAPPENEEPRIVIREIWSSPMVFRRAGKNHTLCDDATAFNREVHRRIALYREARGVGISDGDRIKIIGEDEDGKTDDLLDIVARRGDRFSTINGKTNDQLDVLVLGPLSKQDTQEEEDALSKNHSSVILQFSLAARAGVPGACLFLAGGDAEVLIWEKLWELNRDDPESLAYDLLLSPHHCSWHSLSYDSWGQSVSPKVSVEARSALSQTRPGAMIVASSDPIREDMPDPPCVGAKREYVSITTSSRGEFFCTGEHPTTRAPEPLEFTITSSGPQAPGKKQPTLSALGIGAARQPLAHG